MRRKKIFQNGLLDTWIPVLIIRTKLCANNPECFRSKKIMYSTLLFWIENFLFPKVFFWTRGFNAFLPTLEIKIRPATSSSLPKSQEVLVSAKKFSRNCSARHVECLPCSSRFLLKFFWIQKIHLWQAGGFFSQKVVNTSFKIRK